MKSERLIIRITPELKAQIKKQAQKHGKSISQHVIDSATSQTQPVRTTEPGARTTPQTVRTTKGNAVADYFDGR